MALDINKICSKLYEPEFVESIHDGFAHINLCLGCSNPICEFTSEVCKLFNIHKSECDNENCEICIIWFHVSDSYKFSIPWLIIKENSRVEETFRARRECERRAIGDTQNEINFRKKRGDKCGEVEKQRIYKRNIKIQEDYLIAAQSLLNLGSDFKRRKKCNICSIST